MKKLFLNYKERNGELIDMLNNRTKPKPGDVFLHFKGNEYLVLKTDIILCSDAYFDPLIMYKRLDNSKQIYTRFLSDFLSFTDKVKYPNAKQKYRFEYVRSIFKEETIMSTNNEFDEKKYQEYFAKEHDVNPEDIEIISMERQEDGQMKVKYKNKKEQKIERIRRITGYLSNVDNWNDAKKEEEKNRTKHV